MPSQGNRLNNFLFATTLLLSLPTGAILISNQALPGDTFYPIKTSLEKAATFIFSSSYSNASELQIKLIERRILENQKLILSSGSTQGLQLLIAQAESAKEYIINSNASPVSKKVAVNKLIKTLKATQQTLNEEKPVANSINKIPSNNPTVSQGNNPAIDPTKTTLSNAQTPILPTEPPQPTLTSEIEEAQNQLEEIIDDAQQSDYSEINNQESDDLFEPSPQPESTSTTTPNPTYTPTLLEEIQEFVEDRNGRNNSSQEESQENNGQNENNLNENSNREP